MISHSISFCNLLRLSIAFDRVRSSRAFWQVPNGLSDRLAREFHLVEAATRMQLASMGKVAHSVPFTKGKTKMTVYKGDAALETRRAVAFKLTPSLIAALQRPRRLDDKPDWAPMQQLYDAGLSYDPVSGMPVFDPSCMKPGFQKALWRGFCGIADTINTKQMGQTDDPTTVWPRGGSEIARDTHAVEFIA